MPRSPATEQLKHVMLPAYLKHLPLNISTPLNILIPIAQQILADAETMVKKTVVKQIIGLLALSLAGCSEGIPSNKTIDFRDSDRELFIQPIQVCNDSGSHCANVNMFEDITRRILEQAQLKVSFLPINKIRASRFLKIEDSNNRASNDYEFYELSRSGRAGAFGRHADSTRTDGPINVWFVEEIEAAQGFTQFGLAWVDANGVLISNEASTFNGTGRPDTLAHEIGHNLGLRHTTLGAGDPNNLLTDGGRRNIPSSVEDTSSVSQLTDAQIAEIKRSGFLTPNGGKSSKSDFAESGETDELHYHHDHEHNDHDHDDHDHDHDLEHDRLIAGQSRALQSFAGVATVPNLALVSVMPEETTRPIPEPDSWAGLSLFAILLAARRKTAVEVSS